MMAGALDGTAVRAQKLSHEGTFGVGYGVCTYAAAGPDENRRFLEIWSAKEKEILLKKRSGEDLYVQLARAGVESAVRRGRRLPDREILEILEKGEESAGRQAASDREKTRDGEKTGEARQDMLSRRAGTFVSIHKNGRLRGCIGTIGPTCRNIAQEIAQNAVSAATRDPRFPAIRPEELEDLEITVDVLGDTEPVDSPSMLDVKRYGVIVTKGRRRGLLLPNLEGVDTVEEQIAIAMQKAGLDTDEENYTLERFEVVRHY